MLLGIGAVVAIVLLGLCVWYYGYHTVVKAPPGMVYIPAGWFRMGCSTSDKSCFDFDGEKPYHRVYLNAFFIDRNDVTVGDYSRCVHAGRCTPPHWNDCYIWAGGWKKGTASPALQESNKPVVCVDWTQSTTYCTWQGKHLPSEAQWEKAARGTDGKIYPWGNTWDPSKACFNQQSTCAVGSHPQGSSAYGVLDMAGNVWQWCSDWYSTDYYSKSPDHNPQGPDRGQFRVLRGGSWFDLIPAKLRTSYRNGSAPSYALFNHGFRCAR